MESDHIYLTLAQEIKYNLDSLDWSFYEETSMAASRG